MRKSFVGKDLRAITKKGATDRALVATLPAARPLPLCCQGKGLVEVLVRHALGFSLQIVPLACGHLHQLPADCIDVHPRLSIEVLTSTSQGIDNPKQIVMLKFMFDILLQRIRS